MEYIIFKNTKIIFDLRYSNNNFNNNIQEFNYFKLNTLFKTYPNHLKKINKKDYFISDINDKNILKDKECAICYSSEFIFNNDKLKPVKLINCDNNTHIFHNECINHSLKYKNQCPVCKKIYGYLFGNLPDGTMQIQIEKVYLDMIILIQ